MFIDKAKIHLKSGKGGDGAVAFRKEKYVPAGGPAGGDGGKGGNIIFVVDEGMRTLMDFRYKMHYSAENGENGKGRMQYGKDGEDLILRVPPGTIIREEKTGHLVADLTQPKERRIIAKGGKGGKGNVHFKSATRQAPQFAIAGVKGEELTVTLELKLIADVGLVGFPNVGKSTLLSVVTSAKPKIADYHFTTLTPNLGVVRTKRGDSFVLADIPGLIEGAHEGTGLGHEFLRHVERTKLLIHVLDVAGIEGRDPLEDFEKINEELKLYNEKLSTRPQVVAANKTDVMGENENLKKLTEALAEKGIEVFPVSAATKQGLDELLDYVSIKLKELEDTEVELEEVEEEKLYELKEKDTNQFTVKKEDDTYIVEGDFLERLIMSTNFEDMDSLTYFQKVLRRKGIIDELKKLGIEDGEFVKIYDVEFEYFH
ncbi:GTP-binding protein Obg/CgtA [Alkaliphilus metalliredigens QYMF]|uniref:GTPase Obg n=1 Tax=Alkaliphilus metalliredigens (strain QYMF) TaxID=293826 RepID=OBG_ALKMQ|nr:GTPase ObgE [Alkaliphilus metalliredigens]A6TQJ6.1 RecName: Full=GTPase Obg; AltName: Full=GTP-binding protein Obg [Alkaliphilus metalliredigens QYMF]ABR48464.1 GTP-binding protein Obg/CgtA [Alkaliphilus metalliredigens QYMF]